jgi:hypothetical protein
VSGRLSGRVVEEFDSILREYTPITPDWIGNPQNKETAVSSKHQEIPGKESPSNIIPAAAF